MADNLCLRRRRLYERQLTDAKEFFAGLAARAESRMAAAISEPSLINALEEILNTYVVYGVWLDLQRLAPRKALFLEDTSSIPYFDDVPIQVDATHPAYPTDPNVKSEASYDRYFTWYIDP